MNQASYTNRTMGKPARNDITRDKIKTKPQSEDYRNGWERIFGDKPKRVPAVGEGDRENVEEIEQWERDNGAGT